MDKEDILNLLMLKHINILDSQTPFTKAVLESGFPMGHEYQYHI